MYNLQKIAFQHKLKTMFQNSFHHPTRNQEKQHNTFFVIEFRLQQTKKVDPTFQDLGKSSGRKIETGEITIAHPKMQKLTDQASQLRMYFYQCFLDCMLPVTNN